MLKVNPVINNLDLAHWFAAKETGHESEVVPYCYCTVKAEAELTTLFKVIFI